MMGHSLVPPTATSRIATRISSGPGRNIPSGPAGVFLKRGQHPTGAHLTASPPFVAIDGRPDADPGRLYYGKSFIYPALAAPFVWLFGTNGFLFFNALLLTAAFLAAYLFVSARSGVTAGLLLAGAFVFASVVPVYFVVDRARALQFFARAAGVFFLAAQAQRRRRAGPAEPVGARSAQRLASRPRLLGILTFSKVTNVLLAAADARVARVAPAVASGARDHGDLRRRDAGALRDQHRGHRRLELSGRRTEHVLHRRRLSVSDAGQDIRRRRSARAQRGPRATRFSIPTCSGRISSANLVYFVVGRYAGLVRLLLPGGGRDPRCSSPRPGGGRRGNGWCSPASSCRC